FVIANQAGNAQYSAAPQVTVQVGAVPASQTITVTVTAPSTATNKSSFTVAASASSGLAVAYASSGACTNSGATYTMDATKGTCTETISQPGNSNYTAATPIVEHTTVAAAVKPTVSLTGAPAKAANGTLFTVTAASTETGAEASVPVITTTTSSVCTVSNSVANGTTVTATVTIVANSGACDLVATWAANDVYTAATAKKKTTAEK